MTGNCCSLNRRISPGNPYYLQLEAKSRSRSVIYITRKSKRPILPTVPFNLEKLREPGYRHHLIHIQVTGTERWIGESFKSDIEQVEIAELGAANIRVAEYLAHISDMETLQAVCMMPWRCT